MVVCGLLVWMPAHQTCKAIGVRRKSDNTLISSIDWRANRLADILAKLAAQQISAPDGLINVLDLAFQAARHSGCKLGRVTHMANNHTVSETDDSGKTRTTTYRDAMSAPSRSQRRTTEPRKQDIAVVSNAQKRDAEESNLSCDDRKEKLVALKTARVLLLGTNTTEVLHPASMGEGRARRRRRDR
jgi:hypothetical protein